MTDDLTTLRARALWYQEQGWLTHTVKIEDYLALLDRLERAEAAIERVRDVHRRVGASWPHEGGVYVCSADNGRWPCRTVAALDTGKEAGD